LRPGGQALEVEVKVDFEVKKTHALVAPTQASLLHASTGARATG
jgi:hypothetical protein